MCGYAGYLIRGAEPPGERVLHEMADVLAHRGPDDRGFYARKVPRTDIHVGLGHRRLAVIDVAGGSQPMSTDGGRLWIVYNGEVYNFREIRSSLEEEGVRFRTRSDTEVVLELYRRRGPRMLESLQGMFSFAIWDARERILFAARDRLGQKPLYYYHSGRRFAFASEIKALLRLPWVPRKPDLDLLPTYLTHLYVPSPHTFFRGIRKLPPGHFLIWKNGRIRVERYWDVSFAGDSPMPRWALARRLEEAVREATRLRLVSDVPLGAFLSGGLDSSIIAAAMAPELRPAAMTFTAGFDRPEFDERSHARRVSRRLGTDHRELRVTPSSLGILRRLVWFFDEPFGDSSAIPTYLLAKMTRPYVTVALSGDGGDELFGGYDRYRAFLASLATDRVLPTSLRQAMGEAVREAPPRPNSGPAERLAVRWLRGIDRPLIERTIRWGQGFSAEGIARLLLSPEDEKERRDPSWFIRDRWERAGDGDAVHRMMEVDLHTYLPEDLLTKVDVTTMANSLECRSPFLDHRLVELAASIPRRWKVGPFRSKAILREAFSTSLPRRTLSRKKKGFGAPIGDWFRSTASGLLKETLLGDKARSRGLFRMDEVERLIREHQEGVAHEHRLWALLFFETWMQEAIDRPPSLTPPPEDGVS
ncbi:MAG: asparagine synthase (glutamine-hydrolyzing) [Planctomycetota bacterium]|nr:asparagine synthase (glutamine-hydrolyzing) [Planctomycetota bacterium]